MEFNFPGRLLIEKVVLKNFKSYAGETEIGPFHKNFTSVVGPNGSGKSNLLESLLFAFGKRAKKMRLKKLSELIHHSHLHPNLTEASVEVHFINIIDNEDEFDIVPNSNLILSRIVRRNNSSEYKINGKPSTFDEVTKILKHRGIDLEHNRFLILQGEVEQIAMMKPKADSKEDSKSGLLEYLEEIIGTEKYVPDIEEAEKNLESIGDEVASKRVRFEESRKTLETLDQPMKEALTYIDLEKECFCFKSLKAKVEVFQGSSKINEVNQEISVLEVERERIIKEFEKKKKDNEDSIKDYQEKEKEINNLQKNLQKIETDIKGNVDEDRKEYESLMKTKNSINICSKDVEMNTKISKEIEDNIEKHNASLPKLERDLELSKLAGQQTEEAYNKAKAEVNLATEELQMKKNSLESELNPHKRELAICKTDKEARIKELNSINQELLNADSEKIELQAHIENLSETRKILSKEIENLSGSLVKIKQSSEGQSINSENLNAKYQETKNRSIQIQSKIRQIENEEAELFKVKNQFSEILRAKMDKTLAGVIGRLGDLGSIHPKFDVAISCVCPRLDNIVTETVKDGQAVIEYCKLKKLGKVNIIVLDKINVNLQQMNNFKSPDPKAVRLFDQISFSEERLRNVFYFATGNTLFTDSLDDARRIAFGAQRHKVVTSDGNIIDPSGEMRGFAHTVKNKMKTSGINKERHSTGDLIGLRRELKEVDEILENIMKEKTANDMEFNLIKTQERETIQALKVSQNKLKLCCDDLDSADSRFKIIAAKSKSDLENERKNLMVLIEKITEKCEKTEKLISHKNEKILDLQSKIDQVAGDDFVRLKNELEKNREKEEKLESELSKVKNKLTQLEKDLKKYSNQKQKGLADLEKLNADKLMILERRTKLAEHSKALAEEFKVVEQNLESNNEKKELLKRQKENLAKEFEQLIQARHQAKESIKKLISQKELFENEIKKWETKLQHIKAEYHEIEKEYSGLVENMEIETSQMQSLDHQSRRLKFVEERVNLRRPVEWEGSEEELSILLPKLKDIEEIEKILENELAVSKPNLRIIDEYKQKKSEKHQKEELLTQIRQQETELRNRYIDLKNKRFNEFTRGFREISQKLKEMYGLLTRGGNAELEFADSTDPFSEGIIFTVRPPQKSWKKMSNLSGGEKTLSSLALVFALHHYKPNALYVMDEVDAALDFQNVGIIANYIKGETKNAQFVVVSLRSQMFELADQLVGIYKVRDVTRTLTVTPASLRRTESTNSIIRQTIENISTRPK